MWKKILGLILILGSIGGVMSKEYISAIICLLVGVFLVTRKTKRKKYRRINHHSQTIKNPKQPLPKNFVIIDLETTGLEPLKDDIVEVGIIKVKDFEIIDQYHTYCNPLAPIENSHIHGITDEMVKDYEHVYFYFDEILKFIGNSPVLIYNAPFDWTFLNFISDFDINNDVVDVLRMSRKYENRESHKLELIKNDLGLDAPSHNAIDDCKTTLFYYKYLIEKHNITSFPYFKFNHDLKRNRAIKQHNIARLIIKSYKPNDFTFKPNHILFNQLIVFTGNFKTFTVINMSRTMIDLGAKCNEKVTLKTNYLVVGYDGQNTLNTKTAIRYNETKNTNIKIIDEEEFLKLLNA